MSKFIILLALLTVGYQAQARPEPFNLWGKIAEAKAGFENFIQKTIRDGLSHIKEYLQGMGAEVQSRLGKIQDIMQVINELRSKVESAGQEVAEHNKELLAPKIEELKDNLQEFVVEAGKTTSDIAKIYLGSLIELLQAYIKILENESPAAPPTDDAEN